MEFCQTVLENRYENSRFLYTYTNILALIRERYAFIRESYALLRDKYNYFLYENEPNELSYNPAI